MSDDATLDEFVESETPSNEEGFIQTAAGKIPVGWSTINVERVCELRNGEATDHVEIGAEPYLVYGSNGAIGSYTESNFEGGLIFGRVGAVGEIERVTGPVWVSDNAIQAQVSGDINAEYLYYCLTDKELSALATKTAQPLLNQSTIGNVTVPIPPLSEQRKIATVLHTVDQAIQRTEEIIRQFERIHQGLFLNLIPRGIGHDEYDDVRILGRTVQIPSSWEITTVSQACSNIIDYRGKNPEFSEEGIPHLRNINISRGEIILDDIKYVSQETYDEWMTRGIPEKGDTLLSTEAPMGKTAVLPDLKFSLSQRLIVLSPSNQFDSRFFAHLMGSPFVQKEYDARATGSTVKGISNYNLQEVTIPVPPKKEQEQIAQYIDDTLEAIQKNEQQVKRLQHLKQGLMQDLLSGEVRTTDVNMDIPEEVAKYG